MRDKIRSTGSAYQVADHNLALSNDASPLLRCDLGDSSADRPRAFLDAASGGRLDRAGFAAC